VVSVAATKKHKNTKRVLNTFISLVFLVPLCGYDFDVSTKPPMNYELRPLSELSSLDVDPDRARLLEFNNTFTVSAQF
jgi:hypothetical protein